MRGRTTAIIGAQYGSEGKGVIVHTLANEYDVHVRVGGPNAGHTFKHDGQMYVMQSLPIGWCNPKARLVIGRGALVDIDMLLAEIDAVEKLTGPEIWDRVHIDAFAGVISPYHQKIEGGTKGALHHRIGSTGKGVGAARSDRLNRHHNMTPAGVDPHGPGFYRVCEMGYHPRSGDLLRIMEADTPGLLAALRESDKDTLLEGTQGSGLSLIHGPWPYVTSHDTNAAQIAADCGIPPQLIDDVILVARTYPIRVAGNSGPLRNETTWQAMSLAVGRDIEEHTTVTKKVRRIGEWDPKLITEACTLNAPSSIALTFMDYLSPDDTGKRREASLSKHARQFINYVESLTGVGVSMVGTGDADTLAVIRREE